MKTKLFWLVVVLSIIIAGYFGGRFAVSIFDASVEAAANAYVTGEGPGSKVRLVDPRAWAVYIFLHGEPHKSLSGAELLLPSWGLGLFSDEIILFQGLEEKELDVPFLELSLTDEEYRKVLFYEAWIADGDTRFYREVYLPVAGYHQYRVELPGKITLDLRVYPEG